MLKILGGTVGIVFLIGLAVTTSSSVDRGRKTNAGR